MQSSDGNLVGGGSYTVLDIGMHGGYPFGMPHIAKYDTSGNLLWNYSYGPVRFATGLYSICEGINGDIIGAGQSYFDTTLNQPNGIVLRVNSQGDSIWFRNYAFLHGRDSDNILYDIKSLSDSGFIASGTLDPSTPDIGTIDTWILKIDSMGCDTANCWMSLGINESTLVNDDLLIYPNPSSGIFNFQLMNNEIEKLEVFNYTGEAILFLTGHSNALDLSWVASGIYFYKITSKSSSVFQGKLVKL
ncbi:MAG: T9SS type A sorting domain-containing protein [Bacteroidota bacterium]